MLKRIFRWFKSERGQDVMEYALITGGIAVVLVIAIMLFTDQITNLFTFLGSCIDFSGGLPTCS